MQEANSPPVPGPIILAKVGRPPSESRDNEPQDKSLPRWQLVLGQIEVLALVSCGSLTLAAALHRQWNGLLWIGAGALCSAMIAALVLPLARHRRRCRHLQSLENTAGRRDERTVVLIDRLKEYTASGALGTPAPATGAVAWLTDEGIFLQSGRHLPWSNFGTFTVRPASMRSLGVLLRWRTLSPTATVLAVTYILLWFSAGLATGVLGTVQSLHRFGLRDDVLALILATLFWLVFLVYMVLLFFFRNRHVPQVRSGVWLALISREAASEEDVHRLLSTHLVERKAVE